jgi:hypothetical protein
LVVRARSGDTLATIGKRYGMTIGWMERINRRFRTDPVLPAEPIVVYTERQQAAPGDILYVDAPARLAGTTRPLAPLKASAAPAVSGLGARSGAGSFAVPSDESLQSITMPSLREGATSDSGAERGHSDVASEN